jgi:hypothetical protein
MVARITAPAATEKPRSSPNGELKLRSFPSSSLYPITAFGKLGVSVGEGPQFPARFTGKGQSKAPGAPAL